VAVTAEPSEDLDLARRALDELGDEVVTLSPWRPSPEAGHGAWYLELALRPAGLTEGGPIPVSTRWVALVSGSYPQGQINIMPAAAGGITATFPHQEANDPANSELPWRWGKLCLVDTIHGHELAAMREDPVEAYPRLVWHVARALEWLRRASAGKLLGDGEPFELPIFGQFAIAAPQIGFFEDAETFQFWNRATDRFGIADLVDVRDDGKRFVAAVQVWRDGQHNVLLAPGWGRAIAGAKRSAEALWFRFDRVLVRDPWRSPQTIGELLEFASEQGVDVLGRFQQANAILRDGKSHDVLLGFPVPLVMGQPPSRMQWVGFRLAALTTEVRKGQKNPTMNGFRNKAGAWFFDRLAGGALADDRAIEWSRTRNWAPEELAARGRFDGALANRRVALIGAGALGAAMADLLVRGGVQDLAILDGQIVDATNLSRHELTMRDITSGKAGALAARLNVATPNARADGFDVKFPATGDAAAALDSADLVIDATASEALIRDLGQHAWASAKAFASISFSFGAIRLYVYLASGSRFPSADFFATLAPWINADERPASSFPHEGTGCWSSVFPARADDVASLAAIAVRHLDLRVPAPVDAPSLTVFERHEDCTVSILPPDPP
jgi:molybdopterin/thiamine biosynthesis adenylyltransferase